MESYGWLILGTLTSAFVGSFVAGYLRKKGENLATHEDLDRLVKRVEATTQVTKSVEARISSEVWDTQKRWELKRDTVIAVIQAMDAAKDSLMAYSAARQAAGEACVDPSRCACVRQAVNLWQKNISGFDSKRIIALLACSKEFTDTLWEVRQLLRGGLSDFYHGRISSYDEIGLVVKQAAERAIGTARNEVGTDPIEEFCNPEDFPNAN